MPGRKLYNLAQLAAQILIQLNISGTFFVRKIRYRETPVQNLAQLGVALHEKWNRLPQRTIQRLLMSMIRRVKLLHTLLTFLSRKRLLKPWLYEYDI